MRTNPEYSGQPRNGRDFKKPCISSLCSGMRLTDLEREKMRKDRRNGKLGFRKNSCKD